MKKSGKPNQSQSAFISEESIKRPDVRTLKIQPKVRFNKYSQKDVPEIKLCGVWLARLGFVNGQRVSITTAQKRLVIEMDEIQVV